MNRSHPVRSRSRPPKRGLIASAMTVGTGGTVPKRIEPPILALSTAELNAVKSGSKQAGPGLKGRIDAAAAGKC